MKKIYWGIFLFIAGCSLFNEKEIKTPSLIAPKSDLTCEMPALKYLVDSEFITQESVQKALTCFEGSLDAAFKMIRGNKTGEISFEEFKQLYKNKLVPIQVEQDFMWSFIELAFQMTHPEGKSAADYPQIKIILDWIKKYASLYVSTQLLDFNKNKDEIAKYRKKWLNAFYDMPAFISSNWIFNQDQALSLCTVFYEGYLKDSKENNNYTLEQLHNIIKGFWIIKSFFLPKEAPDAISGKHLKAVFKHYSYITNLLDAFLNWRTDDFLPKKIPTNLSGKWGGVAGAQKTFITRNEFIPIPADLLGWAFKQFPYNTFPVGLSQDIVRLSQRLTPKDKMQSGLHPNSFLDIIFSAKNYFADLQTVAEHFKFCEANRPCNVPFRKAFGVTELRALASNVNPNYWSEEHKQLPTKILDTQLPWHEVTTRLFNQFLVTQVFKSIDTDQDGKIDYTKSEIEETKEALDLANSFLRGFSLTTKLLNKNPDSKEEIIPEYSGIKPSTVYKLMGLVGDKLNPFGDKDGKLNAQELYYALQVSDEIQKKSHISGTWYTPVSNVKSEHNLKDYGLTYYKRDKALTNIVDYYSYELPYNAKILKDLSPKTEKALMHALMDLGAQKPIEVVQYKTPIAKNASFELTDYVSSAAAVVPTAVLIGLEKIYIKCDKDEDGLLNWQELDCAVPIMLEIGNLAVESGLIDLKPIVYDGARMTLAELQKPGIPISVAKALLINGSYRTKPDLEAIVKNHVNVPARNILQLLSEIIER
jgi:hypothetical protein